MGAAKHDAALLLNTEVVNVIIAIRQVPKWALIPKRYSDDEDGDDPLLDELKLLRRKIFTWNDWNAIPPLEYLGPFLEIIKSAEISGPVTGAALAGLHRILTGQGVLGAGEGRADRAEALQAIVDAVTACKYESTDPASDEVVLFKILQVLLACAKHPMSPSLSDEHIKTIFEACYRIGQLQSDGGKALLDAAQQTMLDITSVIFSRLHHLAAQPLTATSSSAVPSALSDPDTDQLHKLTHAPAAPVAPAPNVDAAVASMASMTSPDAGDFAPTDTPAVSAAQQPHGIVSVAPPEANGAVAMGGEDGSTASPSQSGGPVSEGPVSGYGLAAISTVFEYIINLIGESKAEDVVFGLSLCLTALHAGGAALERHKRLLDLVIEHLCQNLFEAARLPSLPALARLCQITVLLYARLGKHLLLQLEALVGVALLRIAEGKGRGGEGDLQEAALEGLLDLVHQQNFIHDMYINTDCRIERANVYESLCTLLSKTAFPVNSALGAVHLLSLDGLFSILTTLAKRAEGPRNMQPELHQYHDPDHFVELWDALCKGQPPPIHQAFKLMGYQPATWADIVRCEKYFKGRLTVAADHFNRDPKKGFQFLQEINLLPTPLTATDVAKFLRSCPGLNKTTLGELLGEADDFYLDVLEAFTLTFDFGGMRIDSALRTYLETFRLPGEAQKINRIMESFGKHYHTQCPGLFKHSDGVYVLAYSVIMLNTDQHNDQVKTKMTVEEFIRNNRGINAGEDLPVNLLRSLYESIRRNEIKIYNAGDSTDVSPVFWTELLLTSRLPRGQMLPHSYSLPAAETSGIDRDMFSLVWGPTLAAVSVVLDHSHDPLVIRQALEGLKLVAKMAAFHQLDQVIDTMVTSLAKYTMVLHPAAPKPMVAFGDDPKAQAALETMFAIANMHGDSLRGAWKNIMDITLRLHRLDVLPVSVFMLESDDIEAAKARVPRPVSNKRTGSSGSLLSRAISSLISIDGGEQQQQPTPREVEATERALTSMEACHVDEVFADSKFLLEASLTELVAAVRAQAGPIPPKTTNSVDDLNTAEVCLELLIMLSLRNRDRILRIWPVVHDMLAAAMDERAFRASNPLVERSAFGLLRVCRRLLPYKEDVAEELLKSLKLICRLNANVAWELAEPISAEVLALLKASAGYIKTADGWNTVCLLLTTTSIHPGAANNVFEALGCICGNQGLLNEVNFGPCLETALRFAEQYAKEASVERSIQALLMLEGLFVWLLVWRPSADTPLSPPTSPSRTDTPRPSKQARIETAWWALVQPLSQYSLHTNPALRNNAIEILKRVLMSSESLLLSGTVWLRTLTDIITPLTGELAGYVSSRNKSYPGADKSLRLAVQCLTKTALQYMSLMLPLPGFAEAWSRMLVTLQAATKNQSEELAEAVPECVKNMLLVMAAKGILVPEWRDVGGKHNLWDLTWAKVKVVSQSLVPSMLASSSIPGFGDVNNESGGGGGGVGVATAQQQQEEVAVVNTGANGVVEVDGDIVHEVVLGDVVDAAAAVAAEGMGGGAQPQGGAGLQVLEPPQV